MSRSARLTIASVTSLILASATAGAQTLQPVVSAGNPFLGFTIEDFRDIAVRDDGSWFAAVRTFPAQGESLSIIRNVLGVDGVFTPGLVTGPTGVSSTLLYDFTQGDFWQTDTPTVNHSIITVSGVVHGLIPGEAVELTFNTFPCPPICPPPPPPYVTPAGGVFTVLNVLDEFTFTVAHGTDQGCGGLFAPCGNAMFVHRIQSADLHVSAQCMPAFQGVLQLEDDSNPVTPPAITPNSLSTGLFWNSTMLLREGQTSNAPQVAAGTTYRRIWRSQVDSRQDYYAIVRMDDPTVSGTENALVKLDVSNACPPMLVSEQVLVRTGDVIQNAGGDRFASFQSLEQRAFDTNERGDFIYLASLTESDGFPSAEARVVVNNRSMLKTFSQVPGGINTNLMVQFPMASVDMNDLGDYVVQVKVQEGPPPHNAEYGEAILKGHVSGNNPVKFIQSGELVPDPAFRPNGEILVHVGRVLELTAPLRAFPALVTNGGDVIWYGQWGFENVATVITGSGIFFNHKVIAYEGQVYGTDDVLLFIGNDHEQYATEMEVSANGRYLVFEGVRGKLSDPSFEALSIFRIDLGESVPYGTVVQATGGGTCTYAYPGATLACTPGLPLPLSSAFGDFPLLGHQFQALAFGGPASTTSVQFYFTPDAPANFPCGFFLTGFPHEILLGPSASFNTTVPYVNGFALHSSLIPPTSLGQIGQDWFGQAYFKNGAQYVGATNAIRFVIGAP